MPTVGRGAECRAGASRAAVSPMGCRKGGRGGMVLGACTPASRTLCTPLHDQGTLLGELQSTKQYLPRKKWRPCGASLVTFQSILEVDILFEVSSAHKDTGGQFLPSHCLWQRLPQTTGSCPFCSVTMVGLAPWKRGEGAPRVSPDAGGINLALVLSHFIPSLFQWIAQALGHLLSTGCPSQVHGLPCTSAPATPAWPELMNSWRAPG